MPSLPKEIDGRIIMLDGHSIAFKKDFEFVKTKAKKAIDECDSALFGEFQAACEQTIKQNLAVAEKLSAKQAAKRSDDEWFNEFCEKQLDLIALWTIVFPLSFAVDAAAEETGHAPEILAAVKPFKEPLVAKQNKEFLELADELRKKNLAEARAQEIAVTAPELAKRIEEHVARYAWAGVGNFRGEPYDVEKFLEDSKHTLTKAPDGLKQTPAGFSEKERKIIEIAGKLAFYRQHLAEIAAITQCASLKHLNEIATRAGLTRKLLLCMTRLEIKKFLEKGELVTEKELLERENHYCLVPECVGGVLTQKVFVANDVEEYTRLLLPKHEAAQSEARGMTACRGEARGAAKIIRGVKEFARFNKGDVLIAPETTPEFVPLMKKAAAVVTDLGGVTSHAAIVSRELGVPCIVGTRIATKIFKDGDIVEVDASRGIVKKIR